MLACPPHILVTTPESLHILLTAEKSREILRDVKTVIVDEIHAVADDKRGAPGAFLGAFGISDRQPLCAHRSFRYSEAHRVVARFLSGADRPDPQIAQIGFRREMDLAIEVPRSELGPITTNEMWDEIYNRIAELATQHRSTLVFVNTRRLTERVALHLGERLGKNAIATHHGSLSRRLRLAAEKKLKAGELCSMVATGSLELGIDIGSIDLVCQIGSPRSISAQFLHRHGASFFTDIVRGTGKLKAEVETALWELVAAGPLTADGFDNLRALIDPKRRAGHGKARSARPRHSAGRWSLLYSDDAVDRPRAVEATCWMLLRRYGVVFRDVLVRETLLPSWRELLITLRRLEDRGEVRGGRFVSGFLGEQFALPVAVESLRALHDLPPSGETIAVSAADPLNLVGILVPGERVSATSGRFVAFRDGVALPPEERPGILSMAAAR